MISYYDYPVIADIGANVQIIAKVGNSEDKTELFYLLPISIKSK